MQLAGDASGGFNLGESFEVQKCRGTSIPVQGENRVKLCRNSPFACRVCRSFKTVSAHSNRGTRYNREVLRGNPHAINTPLSPWSGVIQERSVKEWRIIPPRDKTDASSYAIADRRTPSSNVYQKCVIGAPVIPLLPAGPFFGNILISRVRGSAYPFLKAEAWRLSRRSRASVSSLRAGAPDLVAEPVPSAGIARIIWPGSLRLRSTSYYKVLSTPTPQT